MTIGQLWAVADALHVELHVELRVPPDRPTPIIPPVPKENSSR